MNIAIGVQMIIACLVTHHEIKYEEVTVSMLDKLRGSNAEAAPRVMRVLFPDTGTAEVAKSMAILCRKSEVGVGALAFLG